MGQAELDDAVQAAGERTRADVTCEPAWRPWLDRLADFALSLGEEVTEVPSARSIVFRMPYWLMELLPRANGIDIRLSCDAAELAGIAGGVQSSSFWTWIANSAVPGNEGAIFSVNAEGKLDAAFALMRRAYERAAEET
jgi:hypothetical protein